MDCPVCCKSCTRISLYPGGTTIPFVYVEGGFKTTDDVSKPTRVKRYTHSDNCMSGCNKTYAQCCSTFFSQPPIKSAGDAMVVAMWPTQYNGTRIENEYVVVKWMCGGTTRTRYSCHFSKDVLRNYICLNGGPKIDPDTYTRVVSGINNNTSSYTAALFLYPNGTLDIAVSHNIYVYTSPPTTTMSMVHPCTKTIIPVKLEGICRDIIHPATCIRDCYHCVIYQTMDLSLIHI